MMDITMPGTQMLTDPTRRNGAVISTTSPAGRGWIDVHQSVSPGLWPVFLLWVMLGADFGSNTPH